MIKEIIVFGSNMGGIHNSGMAWLAFKYFKAEWGKAEGPSGNAYALPVKHNEKGFPVLSLREIKANVDKFVKYAQTNPDCVFKVMIHTALSKNYKPEDIASMFYFAPSNCILPMAWKNFLPETQEGRKFSY